MLGTIFGLRKEEVSSEDITKCTFIICSAHTVRVIISRRNRESVWGGGDLKENNKIIQERQRKTTISIILLKYPLSNPRSVMSAAHLL